MLTSDQIYAILLKSSTTDRVIDTYISEWESSVSSLESALFKLFKPGNLRFFSDALDYFRPMDHHIAAAVKNGQLNSDWYSKYLNILDDLVKLYPTIDTAALYANMHPDTVSGLALKYFNSFNTAGLRMLPIGKILIVCQRCFDMIKNNPTDNNATELAKIACALCLFSPDTDMMSDHTLYRHSYMELAKALDTHILDSWQKLLPFEKTYILGFESTLYDFAAHEVEFSSYYSSTNRQASKFIYLPRGWDIQKITSSNKLSYLEELYGDKFEPSFFKQLNLQQSLLGNDISLEVLKNVEESLKMKVPLEDTALPEFTY